ncbi:MAG: hypothetical protein AAF658_17050, partial [Myxococcota bacterium]
MRLKPCNKQSVGCAAVLMIAGCALGNGAAVDGPVAEPTPTTTRPTFDSDVIKPSGPASRTYGGRAPKRSRTPFLSAMDRQFAIPADARLDAVARDLVGIAEAYPRLPYGVVEFLMQHYGVAEPVPEVVTLKRSARTLEELARGVAQAVREETASRRPSKYGAAELPIEGGFTVVVLLSRHEVKMAPLRRRQGRSDVIEFRGELPDGFSKPTIYRTAPNGA